MTASSAEELRKSIISCIILEVIEVVAEEGTFVLKVFS
jgi:hypothetical protein